MSDDNSDIDDYEGILAGNEGMLDMLNLISQLQSDRMNNQRAELRPLPPHPPHPPGASLPGQQAANTIGLKPEEDFLEIIARVQGSRLEDQRTELPRPQSRARTEQPAPPLTPAETPSQGSAPPRPEAPAGQPGPAAGAHDADDDAFFAQLMRAQSSRLEDQRATIGGSRKKN